MLMKYITSSALQQIKGINEVDKHEYATDKCKIGCECKCINKMHK